MIISKRTLYNKLMPITLAISYLTIPVTNIQAEENNIGWKDIAAGGTFSLQASAKSLLQQIDPVSYIRMNQEKALLLLHCQEDTSIPIDSQLYYIDAITTEGKPTDHIQLVEYPRVNHQITLEMLQKIKEFLDKNLLSLRRTLVENYGSCSP